MSGTVPSAEPGWPTDHDADHEAAVDTDPYLYSLAFYWQYADLLPAGFGIVAQVKQPTYADGTVIAPIETITFDARDSSNDRFLWEVVHGDGGARKIWHLTFDGRQPASGRFFETTIQGALFRKRDMDAEELARIEAHLFDRLASSDIQASISSVERNKQRLRERLETVDNRRDKGIIEVQLERAGFSPLSPFEDRTLGRPIAK